MNIIHVKNISKKYSIYHQLTGYVTLRDVLMNAVKHPFGFTKHKVKKILGKVGQEDFWALKDVSFTVEHGEAVGIIGANGAGKSTLLKILSRITPPTEGEAMLQGRISSLLEVGTGFHQELTGRENIFLNGAILGMTKKEITQKFDNIVKFSGVEKFIDTQVKYYSSGMQVRLAFSVAAHLDPEILLVDEVLAVGDAEFQKKCLGKMDEVTKQSGRTILFVSHNMAAIQNLCKRCILLEKGMVKLIGESKDVVHKYLRTIEEENKTALYEFPKNNNIKMQIRKIAITDYKGKLTTEHKAGKPFSIEIEYDVNDTVFEHYIWIVCTNHEGVHIFTSSDNDNNPSLFGKREKGIYKTTFRFPATPKLALNSGTYFFRIRIGYDKYNDYIIPIKIEDSTLQLPSHPGILITDKAWSQS